MTRLPFYNHSYITASIDDILCHPERNAYWTYLIVEQGTLHITLHGRCYTVRGGADVAMLILPPSAEYGNRHGKEYVGQYTYSKDFRCIGLFTCRNDLDPMMDFCMHKDENHVAKLQHVMCFPVLPMGEGYLNRLVIYKRMYWQTWLFDDSYRSKADEVYQKNILDSLLRALFLEMLWAIERNMQVNTNLSRTEELLRAFSKAVEEHYESHRTVEWYADRLHITPKHLAYVCQSVGMSPMKIIHFVTIRQIRYLLINTELSVKEIAGRLGFDSTDKLCRFFKKETGVNPMEYKNR